MARLGGVSWQQLLDSPSGFNLQRKIPYNYLEHLETEDKKVHIAIPEFIAGLQQLRLEPESGLPEFPLKLSTICRSKANTNTMFHNLAWQKKNNRDNHLRVHPVDATNYHINDGECALLVSQSAKDIVTIYITDEVQPGTVHLSHGWGLQERSLQGQSKMVGTATGQFSSHQNVDHFTGMPVLSGMPCRIEPII